MKMQRKSYFLFFWLLAYLIIAQTTIGHFVLCFDPGRSVAIEAGECACPANAPAAFSVINGNFATDDDELCKDIILTTDIPRTASSERVFYSSQPALRTSSLTHAQNLCLFSAPTAPIFPNNLSIHPSIRTTVLLI